MNTPELTATITGWAAADAQQTTTQAGTPVARARVPYQPRRRAADGQWENAGDPTWVTIIAWGDDAVAFAAAIRKGTQVTATGRPSARAWTDNEGRTRVDLTIDARTWGIIPPDQPAPTPTPPAPTAAAGWDAWPAN